MPPAPPGASLAPGAPRLIVLVVIDQFRADYLVRFRERFGAGGFNRLLRQGAHFSSCFYPYAITETAPGHATLATGTTPNRHGIPLNHIINQAGERVDIIADDSAPLIGSDAVRPGVSPRALIGTTLADELRLATGGAARVFGVALKDRAAILSTGHSAGGAYWYDRWSGRFITSRYYRETLPEWAAAFNERRPADRYKNQPWKIGERVVEALDADNFYRRLRYTPYANELVLEFTRELIQQEQLGADAVTDFLAVGLSANDYVGHERGPYSEEVAEITARTDTQLADFLRFLDRRVGAGRYWLVLAADHGVAPTLAQARAQHLDAKNISSAALQDAVETMLAARWGKGPWLARPLDPLDFNGLTFNWGTLQKYNLSAAQAALLAGDTALGIDGVAGFVAGAHSRVPLDLEEAYRLSSFPGRGPDVTLVHAPFAVVDADDGDTDHETPYSYDTHVPLILLGAPFRAGTYRERVSPADLAPTLAAALGINPPALSSGNILTQALRAPATAASAPPPQPAARPQ